MPVHATPDEHPNADLVRRAHAAFKAGDMNTVKELFDYDGMVWTVTGKAPTGGVTVGMDGVMRNFGDIMAWTQGSYNAAPVDYLGSDDHVVALAHVTATRGDGKTLDVDEVVIFSLRDGKLASAQHMAYDEELWDDFFTGMPSSR